MSGSATPSQTSSSISTGSLRAKISLKVGTGTGSGYTVVSPFYTMKPEVPPKSQILGSQDLLAAYDLGHVYSRFCGPKKIKEDLNSFLPHIYGQFNFSQTQDISYLKNLVEKPPITGKEISTLSSTALTGFRLTPGLVDERYRHFFDSNNRLNPDLTTFDPTSHDKYDGFRYKGSLEALDGTSDEPERKRHKAEKKEKKKKKDKKKKDKKDEERKHKKSPVPPQ